MPQENKQKTQKDMNRNERIEAFLFDKEKATFESIEMFEGAVSELLEILSAFNVESLEEMQGKDGTTPVYGEDYMTDEDLQKIEDFIVSKVPKLGLDLPTAEQVKGFIAEAVAKIPRVTGPAGKNGTPGKNGTDGAPDDGDEILNKIRKVKKNRMLKTGDIRGLNKMLADLVSGVNSIDELRKKVESFVQIIPMQNSDGSSAAAGATLTASDTAPSSPSTGDMWANTSEDISVIKGILFSMNHTQILTGVSNSEIYRGKLESGEKLVLSQIQVYQRGGTVEDSDLTITLYDETNSVVIAVCNLNQTQALTVESELGIDYSIKVNNATGGDVDMCYTIKGHSKNVIT